MICQTFSMFHGMQQASPKPTQTSTPNPPGAGPMSNSFLLLAKSYLGLTGHPPVAACNVFILRAKVFSAQPSYCN